MNYSVKLGANNCKILSIIYIYIGRKKRIAGKENRKHNRLVPIASS